MKKILIVGTGKCVPYLIRYLLVNAPSHNWIIVIADQSEHALKRIADHPFLEKQLLQADNPSQRAALVEEAALVISLLPPHLHTLIARDCLQYKKNLIISSYTPAEMRDMQAEAEQAGLTFLCEMGLDPGIDHMTICEMTEKIRRIAGDIVSMKSYCGGLIAPGSDTSPWMHKITWNSRNVVLAGAAGGQYLEDGQTVEIPYESLFSSAALVDIPQLGRLAAYPNRDSLPYLQIYNIPEARSFMRATLRFPVFCQGWDLIVRLGLTAVNDHMDTSGMSYRDWIAQKTGLNPSEKSFITNLRKLLNGAELSLIRMLEELELWRNAPLPAGNMSSADILQLILEDKWAMHPWDKDMIVMHHEIIYTRKGEKTFLTSTMIAQGESAEYSAMAKTVGLPIAIAARLMLTGRMKLPAGVILPTVSSLYKPVLQELRREHISFDERVVY